MEPAEFFKAGSKVLLERAEELRKNAEELEKRAQQYLPSGAAGAKTGGDTQTGEGR